MHVDLIIYEANITPATAKVCVVDVQLSFIPGNWKGRLQTLVVESVKTSFISPEESGIQHNKEEWTHTHTRAQASTRMYEGS